MNNPPPSNFTPKRNTLTIGWLVVFGCMLLAHTLTDANAQGEIASGTITSSGSGPFTYSLSFSDATNATSPIGSIWYAWVPGAFYLPAGPAKATEPPGWSANISGHSIQFVANSAANDIAVGHTLAGFSFQASFSPEQLAAAYNSGVSVAYSGGLFSDSGDTFTVRAVATPEPLPSVLLVCSAVGFLLFGRARWLTR